MPRHFTYWAKGAVPLDFTKSFLFDGVNESFTGNTALETHFSTLMSGTTEFTVITKLKKTDAVNAFSFVAGNTTTPSNSIAKRVRSSNKYRVQIADSPVTNFVVQETSSTFTGAIFRHWGNIFDSANRFNDQFIDATDVGNSNVADVGAGAITVPTIDAVYIGQDMSGGNFFDGNIHWMAFFDKKLIASEFTELYNSGTDFDFRTSSVSGNLASYFVANNETSWDGANWTWKDLIDTSREFVSSNMEEADLEADV